MSPGWNDFASVVGFVPRADLYAPVPWRQKMVPVSVLKRRQEHLEDFRSARQTFTPPVPVSERKNLGPPPSPPASRLIPASLFSSMQGWELP